MKKVCLKLIDTREGVFIFAFILMALYLFPQKDLIARSGDAVETWKVVTTFLNSNPEHSYVMYKGFLSIIPNVVLYQLALFWGVDQFFFVKMFNCISFAYISTIGLPYFFSYVFNKKIENYKIYILTIILYLEMGVNFSFISVDASSIVVMLLTVNSVIRIMTCEKKLPSIYYLYMGIIFSMCTLFSGQYLPTVVCTLLFIVFAKVIPIFRKKQVNIKLISIIVFFVVGFSIVNSANNYFVKTRVQPVRDAGQWLPTGGQWLQFALTNNMLMSKYSDVTIPDNRGKAILIKENRDIESIEKGGGSYNYKDYTKLVLKYPVEFLTRWLNRLFLGVSVDNNETNYFYLLGSYTLLFLSLLTFKKNCKWIKDVFDSRTFLILALILPSLVPCLMHVEMRYFMSIQILIAGIALLSDTLWNSLLNFKEFIKQVTIDRKNTDSSTSIQINYTFVSYLIFITLCFLLFATQYELLGPTNANILFKF
ncbi:hypothetical protein [Clostridium aciditolerans]|uniref:Uncharacterized protein n=1 Tax=Clostridium aciditolerans TaxID=339861 RepID=A0A934HZH5_9CLOT|nr:hypothetical protein [Clostridium aciditolerans]MBI6873593.1 hypothetical protein [Clostridium aciditolerans]